MTPRLPPFVLTALVAILTVAASCSSTSGSDSGATASTSAPNPLRVCSDVPYPPFEYDGPDGPVGFDVDLVTEVASRLGRGVEIVPTPLDDLDAAFASGRCDLAASALVVPDPAAAAWPFSVPYLQVAQSVLVRELDASTLTTFDSLGGRRVGVVADSTSADFAAANVPGTATLVPFTTAEDAADALRAGTIDAVVADAPVIGHIATTDTTLAVTETRPTDVRYGLAVAPTDPTLLAQVDEVLTEMGGDGTLERLGATWFGS